MTQQFILIPGRSSRQGVSLNEGKYTEDYLDETSTLRMHPEDMQGLGIQDGEEVRIWNDIGEIVVPCIDAKDECPQGLIFICYGDKSSQLMAGETHGSGMPDSKGLDVWVLPASQPRPAQTEQPRPEPVAEEPESVESAAASEPDAVQPADVPASRPEPPAAGLEATTSEEEEPKQIGPALVMCLLVIALIAAAAMLNLGG